jgi:hypothetical protein
MMVGGMCENENEPTVRPPAADVEPRLAESERRREKMLREFVGFSLVTARNSGVKV